MNERSPRRALRAVLQGRAPERPIILHTASGGRAGTDDRRGELAHDRTRYSFACWGKTAIFQRFGPRRVPRLIEVPRLMEVTPGGASPSFRGRWRLSPGWSPCNHTNERLHRG